MDTFTEIQEILQKRANALVARSALDLKEILDPRFTYVNSHGDKYDRESYIDLVCGPGPIRFYSQKFTDLKIQEFDAFSVATTTLHDDLEFKGERKLGTFENLSVFHKNGGKWMIAAAQTMRKS